MKSAHGAGGGSPGQRIDHHARAREEIGSDPEGIARELNSIARSDDAPPPKASPTSKIGAPLSEQGARFQHELTRLVWSFYDRGLDREEVLSVLIVDAVGRAMFLGLNPEQIHAVTAAAARALGLAATERGTTLAELGAAHAAALTGGGS